MEDEPMPLELEDMPPLEDDDEEFHSLMEDALMEDASMEDEPTEDVRVEDVSMASASELEETVQTEESSETNPEGKTPTKPPVDFQRFAMDKPRPSSSSPICAKPAPFVMKKSKLQGVAPPKITPSDVVFPPPSFKEWVMGKRSTRSTVTIKGDPTKEYLPTRKSKKQ